MNRKSAEAAALSLLRRLSTEGARLCRDPAGGFTINGPTLGRAERCDQGVAETLVQRGLVEPHVKGGNRFALAGSGRALVRRFLSGREDFTRQHATLHTMHLDKDGEPIEVTVNRDESPLAWLHFRKGRDGQPLVGVPEYAAGERLRADFTRGQLMPRVTANWNAAVASERRAGGIAELTEVAMAARSRVERALDAVGPEFAGLLVDVCCFLKGVEEVERERRWPARSAKVVLRFGLAALARHYGLSHAARGGNAGKLRHWGSDDYRPTID